MPAAVSNARVEGSLRQALKSQGFKLTAKKHHGHRGTDIIASRGRQVYHIEVIAYKRSRPARAKDFFEAFFRAVSRLDVGAEHCVIAMSERARVGLPKRAAQHRVAWHRISKAFPELEIWLVDTNRRSYQRTSWREWVREP